MNHGDDTDNNQDQAVTQQTTRQGEGFSFNGHGGILEIKFGKNEGRIIAPFCFLSKCRVLQPLAAVTHQLVTTGEILHRCAPDMHQTAEREQQEQRHAEHQMDAEDKGHTLEMCSRTAVESHHRLCPTHQFHHFAAVHMLGGERNGAESQRTLNHQQCDDHDVTKTGGRPHAVVTQTAPQQHAAANQRHYAAGTARPHRHLLFHRHRQEGFIHPVWRQHPEGVTSENTKNTDVEQRRGDAQDLFLHNLAGTGAPAVLAVVITQPAADQEYRAAQVRVNIEEEVVEEVSHLRGSPAGVSSRFRYCGATAPAKRFWCAASSPEAQLCSPRNLICSSSHTASSAAGVSSRASCLILSRTVCVAISAPDSASSRSNSSACGLLRSCNRALSRAKIGAISLRPLHASRWLKVERYSRYSGR